ncbi:hypothetical protein [Mycobacterium lepromatosis]|uniref:hypothetical protein n=1 Tax=Mycobacterium lepromatosis TaxID=480418 RepID=UPI0012E01A06|nr:hypothetical protein [Mycobacterium lepromatosis]
MIASNIERLKDVNNYTNSAYFIDNKHVVIAITDDPRPITYEQIAELRAHFSNADMI